MTPDDPDATADPHDATLAVYEAGAQRWWSQRRPRTDPADEFSRAVTPAPGRVDPTVVDLGCGPGWHLPHLPAGTVALDGAAAMLDLVPRCAPAAPRVRADLRALPFGTGTLDAAWADRSYVHLARPTVPMALRDLHRCLRVGGVARLEVFEGDSEHGPLPDDDVPGRWFSAWPEALLRHVVAGAGFALEMLERRPAGDVDHLVLWLRRERTLADTVGPAMRLLLVGLNPSEYAADAGVGFARPGNRAWPALLAAGLATTDRDPVALLSDHGIGMTDLVKRATPRADGLRREEYHEGVERLDALCEWLRPAAVCVVGLSGWRAAVARGATTGVQEAVLGGRPVYLMPNPSGINAHSTLEDLTRHLVAAAELAQRSRPDVAG